MDSKYFVYLFTCIVLVVTANGQVTQCNTDEYRAVVLNLEALRAQFRTFQLESAAEISNLKMTVAAMNETLQGLMPGSELTGIRLVGGNDSSEGRVEVEHSGAWGTVCDDDFDNNEATVICRMLGFNGTSIGYDSAHFGEGDADSPIWLDDLACTGTETTLADCGHRGWGSHNCDHSEDAAVKCSNNEI